jgi:starch synthase (maltosyl-transferring)
LRVDDGHLREDGRRRAVVEAVTPVVDGGAFPAKRELGDVVHVAADVFADGHDHLDARLLVWRPFAEAPVQLPLHEGVNDRWTGSFTVDELGMWRFGVTAWVDHVETWRLGTLAKVEAGLDVSVELEVGARLVDDAATEAGPARRALDDVAAALRALDPAATAELRAALDDPDVVALLHEHGRRPHPVAVGPYPLAVEPVRARFSAWYELFPRSAAVEPGRPGTLRDVVCRLPEIAAMGFDVVSLPPIHPIGRTLRKGPNNAPTAGPDDVGSPWAIGGPEGGHDAVHPALGTQADVEHLVRAARELGIEVALDLALQCSPDHPWVRQHPSWFRHRPDGTVQYAENPPKKYQDIYPLEFESEDWWELWRGVEHVVRHWIGAGVRVFRVDNPHTKPYGLWAWLIATIRRDHPDVIWLAEAFTRPKVMHRLAKLGFTQSYTYFTWRSSAWELREYFTELTAAPSREYFRPNCWPNTPDILTEELQTGGRPAFVNRLVLATTLAASYGIYGPAFELAEGRPREPGSEEYLDSEKYQIRAWDRDAPHTLRPLITRMNQIRRAHPALQHDWSLRFHDVDNDQLLVYSKTSHDRRDVVLCVASVDPHHAQAGWVHLDLAALGLGGADEPFEVHDLLGGERFTWRGPHNYVALDPWATPAHVFHVTGMAA